MDSRQINELYDKTLIEEVVLRYSTGVDNKDWELFRSCFTDPVDVDFTSSGAPGPRTFKLDSWVRVVEKTVSPYKITRHNNSNLTIKVNGDEAAATVYLQARHIRPDDPECKHPWDVGGYYTDRLVRTPQGWKIAYRKFTLTWAQGQSS